MKTQSLVRTDGPDAEVISLAEAKAFLRVTASDDDAFIDGLIIAAREAVENFTGRAMLEQEWTLTLSEWPTYCGMVSSIINLERSPLSEVTSIKYFPADGSNQVTLNPNLYHVMTGSLPGMIVLNSTASWPSLADRPDAVEVVFVAGADAVANVPRLLVQACLLHVSHLYENRGILNIGNIVNVLPFTLQNILEQYRVGGWCA